MYKLEIFEKKKIIEKLVLECPVNALVQKRLTNVEDSSIINCWYLNISSYTDTKSNNLNVIISHLCDVIFDMLQYGK
jgi:hypothetical protein